MWPGLGLPVGLGGPHPLSGTHLLCTPPGGKPRGLRNRLGQKQLGPCRKKDGKMHENAIFSSTLRMNLLQDNHYDMVFCWSPLGESKTDTFLVAAKSANGNHTRSQKMWRSAPMFAHVILPRKKNPISWSQKLHHHHPQKYRCWRWEVYILF